VLRDYLKIAKTTRECKKILHKKLLLVDNKIISNSRFPIGLFDVVSLPEQKIFYRVSLDYHGNLILVDIDKKESEVKPLKIINKKRLKNKVIQLNCTSGYNILVNKDVYKTGDTIIYDLLNNKIIKHLKHEKDMTVFITSGKHSGTIAVIKEFKRVLSSMPDRVILSDVKGKLFETLQDYIFIIGDKKPEIKVI